MIVYNNIDIYILIWQVDRTSFDGVISICDYVIDKTEATFVQATLTS
jgi:hypothetical protein